MIVLIVATFLIVTYTDEIKFETNVDIEPLPYVWSIQLLSNAARHCIEFHFKLLSNCILRTYAETSSSGSKFRMKSVILKS